MVIRKTYLCIRKGLQHMIYLVRHGQTAWNLEKKTQGHTDIPLNEKGRNQAKILAQVISNLKIDKIISSDLLRARETAEIINEKIGKNITYDERIREINYGILEGAPRDTLTQEMWDIYNTCPEELKAETKTHVFERIKTFFDELQDSKDNTLIITHGGALRMIMYYAKNRNEFDNNIYIKYFKDIKINNADIFEWKDEIKSIQKRGIDILF